MNFVPLWRYFGSWLLVSAKIIMILLFSSVHLVTSFQTPSPVLITRSGKNVIINDNYQNMKSVILNATNSSLSGASVIMLKDVTLTKQSWQIISTDGLSDFHLKLALNKSWGFDPLYPSMLNITISGFMPVDQLQLIDLILSFSVNDAQYITTRIRMDNNDSNEIYPACNNKIISLLGIGSINDIVSSSVSSSSVSQTRVDKSLNGDNKIKWTPLSYPEYLNDFPITYTIYNDPINNMLYIMYTSNFNSFFQDCLYSSFATNSGFDLYFALDDINQELYISSFDISYTYFPYPMTNQSNLESIYPFSINNLRNFYLSKHEILWYQGMYDNSVPNISLWIHNLDSPPITVTDEYCPLSANIDEKIDTTCWQICGSDNNNPQYMYRYVSTAGYMNISFTFSINILYTDAQNTFCDISFGINNSWEAIAKLRSSNNIVDQTQYLPVSSWDNPDGVGIRLRVFHTSTDCVRISHFYLSGDKIDISASTSRQTQVPTSSTNSPTPTTNVPTTSPTTTNLSTSKSYSDSDLCPCDGQNTICINNTNINIQNMVFNTINGYSQFMAYCQMNTTKNGYPQFMAYSTKIHIFYNNTIIIEDEIIGSGYVMYAQSSLTAYCLDEIDALNCSHKWFVQDSQLDTFKKDDHISTSICCNMLLPAPCIDPKAIAVTQTTIAS